MKKLEDLPEAIHFSILLYLLSPSYFKSIYSLLLVSKPIHRLCTKHVYQEVFRLSKDKALLDFNSANNQLTLRLYYCLFAPKIFLLGGQLENRRADFFHLFSGRVKRVTGCGLKRSDEFSLAYYRGYILAIVGSDDSAIGQVETYNPYYNTWQSFPSLPAKLSASSVSVLNVATETSKSCLDNSILFVLGGNDRNSTSQRSDRIYYLYHDKLSFLPYCRPSISGSGGEFSRGCREGWDHLHGQLIQPRSHHASVAFQGRIWLAGGIVAGQWIATNTVEVVDIYYERVVTSGKMKSAQLSEDQSVATDIPHLSPVFPLYPVSFTSTPRAPMLRHRLNPSLIVLQGCLYAVGGDMEGTSHSVSSIERYDMASGNWVFVTFFPEPRRRTKASVIGHESRIYILGGSDGRTLLHSWDYYEIEGKYWASNIKSFLIEEDEQIMKLSSSVESSSSSSAKMDVSGASGEASVTNLVSNAVSDLTVENTERFHHNRPWRISKTEEEYIRSMDFNSIGQSNYRMGLKSTGATLARLSL